MLDQSMVAWFHHWLLRMRTDAILPRTPFPDAASENPMTMIEETPDLPIVGR